MMDIDAMALAVIPARGGSKRIPRKNVRPFAGRPMIAHAIAAAQAAGVFDRIVVSTDDAEIASVARAHGAEVPFMRPPELSDDHPGTLPVIAHAIAQQRWRDDRPVCCIYPGVPLLDPADLRRTLALLLSSGCDFAFPVLAFPSPVQRAMRRDAQGRAQPLQAEHAATRTQDLEPAFHDAGQFCWGWPAAWRGGISPHAGGATLVLPPWRAVDIDTPEDWARAELLYAALGPADLTAAA
jgi:pseudaminic acid cytidylyltransferase